MTEAGVTEAPTSGVRDPTSGLALDLTRCPSPHSLANKLARVAWGIAAALLFRPSPRPLHAWRRALLAVFGARIGRGARIDPSARIWAPWNLVLGEASCLGAEVDCYTVARVSVGAHATVSQRSFLCAATHDHRDPHLRLVASPIEIGDGAWVCAEAYVGPGISVGCGAVVGARAVVVKDVEPWTVVAGVPARRIGQRVLGGSDGHGPGERSEPAR